MIFRGSGPILLRDPIFFMNFERGGGPDPCTPSGSTHADGIPERNLQKCGF